MISLTDATEHLLVHNLNTHHKLAFHERRFDWAQIKIILLMTQLGYTSLANSFLNQFLFNKWKTELQVKASLSRAINNRLLLWYEYKVTFTLEKLFGSIDLSKELEFHTSNCFLTSCVIDLESTFYVFSWEVPCGIKSHLKLCHTLWEASTSH